MRLSSRPSSLRLSAALTFCRLSNNALLTATSLIDSPLSIDCTDDALDGARGGGLGRFRLVVTPFLRLSILEVVDDEPKGEIPWPIVPRPDCTVPFLEMLYMELVSP